MTNFKLSSKIFIILLIISLIIIPINAADNNYAKPQVIKYIKINDDAVCTMEEDTNYTIKDNCDYITRVICLDDKEDITNITVDTPGLYNDVKIENSSNDIIIKVYLYKNREKTEKVSNQNVKVIYHYSLSKQITMYDNQAEFKYDTCTKDEGEVLKLESYIYLPDTRENVMLWNNPPYLLTSHSWVNKTVYEARYKQLSNDDNAQIRILMPKEYFTTTDNTISVNKNTDSIIDEQNKYDKSIDFNYTVSYILSLISIILIITPPLLYYKQLRNKRFDDSNQIQSSIPYDSKAAFVNLSIRHNFKKVDINAFYATILDLINKNVICLECMDDKIGISIKDNNNLKGYESYIIDCLGKYKDAGSRISLDTILNQDKGQLKNFYNTWQNMLKQEYDLDKCFSNKTAELLQKLSIISIIYVMMALIYIFFIAYPQVPSFDLTFKTLMVLIPVMVISYYLSIKNTGQPTKKANIYIGRWSAFEKFINDYYLINEYHDRLLDNVEKYIIYAMALGDMNSFMVNLKRLYNQMNMDFNIKLLKYMNHKQINDFIEIFNHFD